MPTYDYECDACGHQFEEFQSMRDDALTVCPSCNETALRRLITGGTGVIFKGSGFYVTDSKKRAPLPGPRNLPTRRAEATGNPARERAQTQKVVTEAAVRPVRKVPPVAKARPGIQPTGRKRRRAAKKRPPDVSYFVKTIYCFFVLVMVLYTYGHQRVPVGRFQLLF